MSASRQNQALSAILFLYRHVLHIQLDELALTAFRPQRAKTVPTVLSREEVKRLLANLTGTHKLIAQVMAQSIFLMPWNGNIRIPGVNLPGNTSFLLSISLPIQ